MEIRRGRPDEWRELKELRLRALSDAPDAFGSSVDVESEYPDGVWEQRASDQPLFVAVEAQRWWGMAGIFRPDVPSTVGIWGMWVDPSHRGRGIGRALLDAAVEWAREEGARRVVLTVTESNPAAHRLYVGSGFVPTGVRRPLSSNPTLTEIELARPLE